MFLYLIWFLLVLNASKSIDCSNSSVTEIKLLINSHETEYLVFDTFTVNVRSNVVFDDQNLILKLKIETRVIIKEFIECLNCKPGHQLKFSSSSINVFKFFIKKACEIKLTPLLYQFDENNSLIEYDKEKKNNLPIKTSSLSINIIKSSFLYHSITLFDWLSFLFLIFSFYPQIIENFLTKDTSGLNTDYIMITTIGFISYAIVNYSLYFSDELRIDFYVKYPPQDLPTLKDVLFVSHQILMIIIIVIQSLVFETNQPLSSCGQTFLVANFSPMVVLIFLVVLNQIWLLHYIQFLNFVRFFSLSVRYIPQIVFNYKRCSTYRFSPFYIYLDFLGNFSLLLRIVLTMINYDDFRLLFKIFNNLNNFSQSICGLFFDLVLLTQHFYCLDSKQPCSEQNDVS